MKGKRDRSVAALLVVDVTEERVQAAGAAGAAIVPVINILTKRYGYRFGLSVFTHSGNNNNNNMVNVINNNNSVLCASLELSPEAVVLERGQSHQWLNALLQSKGVSSMYVCGASADTVAELAKEALKIGVVVFVVRDAVIPTPNAGLLREDLEKHGVNFVESQRI